jgi:two-component system, NtrC family, nitrogen regulation response regulator NtrX
MNLPTPADVLSAPELLGLAPATEHARTAVLRALGSNDPVLITGEAGLDALGIARTLHERGPRAAGPFSIVDCASRNAALLEQDIFGNAAVLRPDDFERITGSCAIASATGGTLVFAHVAETPAHLQGRLARLLRDGQVEVDAWGRVSLDLRVMATSAASVEDDMREGRIRRELSVRFALRVDLPPLRHRPSDIPTLVGCFAAESAMANRVAVPTFSREALSLLSALPWRRNVHELREVLDVLVASAGGGTIGLEDVLSQVPLERSSVTRPSVTSIKEARSRFEREYISSVLQRHRWRMEDTARTLGIQRTNLYRKMRQLGIRRPRLQR